MSYHLSFCRLNDEARKLIADLGSTAISNLGFRDNWIFVGGKGIKTKSPFEQVIQPQRHMFISAPFKKSNTPYLQNDEENINSLLVFIHL